MNFLKALIAPKAPLPVELKLYDVVIDCEGIAWSGVMAEVEMMEVTSAWVGGSQRCVCQMRIENKFTYVTVKLPDVRSIVAVLKDVANE